MLRFTANISKNMDINSLRMVIFNHILSKQLEKSLLVRIDDSQKDNGVEGKDKEVLEILNLFAIDYLNIIYQSDNLKYHQKLAMQLMAQKKAFACFCSKEKLEELKQKAQEKGRTFAYDGFCETLSDETVLNCNAPFRVRIKKPNENIVFKDLLKGEFEARTFEVDYFTILNQNKTPTSTYASAIDDMIYDVSTIIEDEKNLLDTARQIYIRKELNYDKEIEYIHIPTISNSDEIPYIKALIEEGFLPSAIANYLVFISVDTPKEIFTLENAVEWFDIKNIKLLAKFDINELKAINKKYLEQIDDLRLSKILGFADSDIGKLGKLFLDEANTIKEIKAMIEPIFAPKSTFIDFEKEFVEIKLCMQEAPFFDDFEQLKNYITGKTGLKDEKLLNPLEYILTGANRGLDISKIYPLIKNYLKEVIK